MKYIVFSLLIVASLSFFAMTARAQAPLHVTYSLYAGGFNVVDIKGTYTMNDDATYGMIMDLETTGILGRLAPWSGVMKTNGIIEGNGLHASPLSHSFASTWRDETEKSTLTFNRDGQLLSYIKEKDDGRQESKMPDEDVYANDPIDVLSALYRTMNGESCASTQSVLDGKRKFNMVFRSKGEGLLKQSKYSSFEGKTEICEVEIIPVAGKWREEPRGWMSIQGQAKDNGQLPRLWFGRVRADMPPIPVRFQIKTDYGTMIMHLKDVKNT